MNEHTAEALLTYGRRLGNQVRLCPKALRGAFDFDRGLATGELVFLITYGQDIPYSQRQAVANELNFLLNDYSRWNKS